MQTEENKRSKKKAQDSANIENSTDTDTQTIPPSILKKPTLPLKIFFADEMRYGLIGNLKRSWNRIGKRTNLAHSIGYVNRYLYTALSPIDGDIFNLIGFDDASTKETDIFLDQLKLKFPDNHLVVIWDNAPFHKPKILHQKEHLSIVFLPSYGQELNPVERYFGEMRKFTANQTFDDIEVIETTLEDGIIVFQNDKEKVKKLACWDWIEEQIKEISLLF